MTAAIRVVPELLEPEARRAILDGLRADTRGKRPGGRRSLTLSLRVEDRFVGGLVGQTFMGWLAVDAFWVAAEHQGLGHGSALMAQAEAEGRRRGATDAVLDTFSFQAPGFYDGLGYREFARLDGFPPGHSRHYMTKRL